MILRLLPLVILLLLRFYDLGIRPPHHDEAVNGWFVDGILNRGYYVYDPQNYHGPLFFYILTVFEKIFGRGIVWLRVVPVIFGSLISFTPFLFTKWLGRWGTWIAAIIFTVSPALIFFSRYAIHETLFTLSCILFFYFWLRVKEEGFTKKTIWGFGLTLGAMATVKENFVLFGGALCMAEGVFALWDKKLPFAFTKKFWIGLSLAVLIAAVMIIVFFSGFFQDSNGIPNFFSAFEFWSQTGEKGNGHQKPFEYWLKIMGSLEWYALFGLLISPFVVLSKKFSKEVRLTGLMSLFLWLIYSVVSYKTPWCVLSFYWGFVFLASLWIGRWIESLKKGTWKGWILLPFGIGCCVSLYQAYDVAYLNPDQEGHYYIYGQTFHDMLGPVNEILDRAKTNPALKSTLRIEVISSFTWPLPYLLGEFKQTAYYGEKNVPATLEADEIIMDKAYETQFASRMKGTYSREEVRSRQWAGPIVFYRRTQ